MGIIPEDIRITIENPDKVFDCDHCGKHFYLKHIHGKGELLVVAEKTGDNSAEVTCFGLLEIQNRETGTENQ